MGYNFAKNLNKSRLFNVNTEDYDYYSLETLYNDNGEDYEYPVLGVYINTSSQFNDEDGIIATDTCYVNLPHHLLSDIKEILSDRNAIRAINDGDCSFKIRKYYKKRYNKDCYTIEWQ